MKPEKGVHRESGGMFQAEAQVQGNHLQISLNQQKWLLFNYERSADEGNDGAKEDGPEANIDRK